MQYRYVGGGLGVPGLPHEITDEQAAARGLTDLLQAAVAAGKYRPETSEEPEDDPAEEIEDGE